MTLPTPYQEYIHASRYARFVPEKHRRETWDETVDRYVDYFKAKFPRTKGLPWVELREAIRSLEVMPSMRCLMTAGTALDRDNVAGYNCAFVGVDDPKVFDEVMYILMCGTGVGFSVERVFIDKLPEIAEEFHDVETTIVVKDSRIGWASATRQLIGLLYAGQIPKWDLSRIRKEGTPLKTFGGRASGPVPLDELFRFLTVTFSQAVGRRLNSLECHDIVCKIADIVVCGGVRRSALLSLSNLTDERMRSAKTGQWWEANPQRALANNSVCYTEKPDVGIFIKEWLSLYESKSGERGIFSRYSVEALLPIRRKRNYLWGTNPCSEIILRPRQFCNLSEIVVRRDDDIENLKRKADLATFAGTLQASLTDFRYLSSEWKRNTRSEALLGVSITGIMDHPTLGVESIRNGRAAQEAAASELQVLKNYVVERNAHYALRLGIEESAATTCVKPSGTVSQLVNSASGIHPRYAPYYVRRVRSSKTDPLAEALRVQGIPYEEGYLNKSEVVFSFPIASPQGSVCVDNVTAIEQLEHWLLFAENWCEHKPSISVYVRPNEWLTVAAWVYAHFDKMTGVSFFPHEEHNYRQAPYETIDAAKYAELNEALPKTLDLGVPEEVDATTSTLELACSSGVCEL
jgi:ribonucleoside-diphosphate reductase alpha chain